MAGPAFKELAKTVKIDIIETLTKGRPKHVGHVSYPLEENTLAGYIDYYLVKPLSNLRDEQPSAADVAKLVDHLVEKHFAKGSECIKSFKKAGASDNQIDKIIKEKFTQFKGVYERSLSAGPSSQVQVPPPIPQRRPAPVRRAAPPTPPPFVKAETPKPPQTKSLIGERSRGIENTHPNPPNKPLPVNPIVRVKSPIHRNEAPQKPLPPDPVSGKGRKPGG